MRLGYLLQMAARRFADPGCRNCMAHCGGYAGCPPVRFSDRVTALLDLLRVWRAGLL